MRVISLKNFNHHIRILLQLLQYHNKVRNRHFLDIHVALKSSSTSLLFRAGMPTKTKSSVSQKWNSGWSACRASYPDSPLWYQFTSLCGTQLSLFLLPSRWQTSFGCPPITIKWRRTRYEWYHQCYDTTLLDVLWFQSSSCVCGDDDSNDAVSWIRPLRALVRSLPSIRHKHGHGESCIIEARAWPCISKKCPHRSTANRLQRVSCKSHVFPDMLKTGGLAFASNFTLCFWQWKWNEQMRPAIRRSSSMLFRVMIVSSFPGVEHSSSACPVTMPIGEPSQISLSVDVRVVLRVKFYCSTCYPVLDQVTKSQMKRMGKCSHS